MKRQTRARPTVEFTNAGGPPPRPQESPVCCCRSGSTGERMGVCSLGDGYRPYVSLIWANSLCRVAPVIDSSSQHAWS
jgi:hypothetical protein